MFRVLAVLPLLLLGPAAPASAQGAPALDNGLAATPPMGWNDWNAFGCGVDRQLVEQTADTLVSSGMRDAGYTYVNIDDCWALPAHASAMYRISPNKRLTPPHVTVGLSSVDTIDPTTVTATVTNDGLLPAVWNQLRLTLPVGGPAQPSHDELIPSAVGPEDVGAFTSSHNKYVDGRADFGSFTVG